jgi:hypothetical protein
MRSSPELAPIAELPPTSFTRQASAQKYVVLQIQQVSAAAVVLMPVLDRYRIPLDQQLATKHTVALQKLVRS